MIKNLSINSSKKIILYKADFHKVILNLKTEYGLTVDGLNINIVGSEEILELNKKYLNHKYTTDIITFNYSEDNDSLEGEIFISLYDAIDNAKKYKVSTDNEILRLVVHGVLHMIGFDDMEPGDKKIMKSHENKCVKRIGSQKLVFIKKYD